MRFTLLLVFAWATASVAAYNMKLFDEKKYYFGIPFSIVTRGYYPEGDPCKTEDGSWVVTRDPNGDEWTGSRWITRTPKTISFTHPNDDRLHLEGFINDDKKTFEMYVLGTHVGQCVKEVPDDQPNSECDRGMQGFANHISWWGTCDIKAITVAIV